LCRVLVTAASRGVGAAISEGLARRGCEIVLNARDPTRLWRQAERLLREYQVKVHIIPGDLTVREDVVNMAHTAIRLLGCLDGVVMNYGNPSREPIRLHEADWSDWVEAAKLYVASTATIAKILIEENPCKSAMLIISSFTVQEPMPPLVVSDTLRAGLSRLARIIAREYPDKIRPVVLLLGSFDTPGARKTIEKLAAEKNMDPAEYWGKYVEQLSPLRRIGRLSELADVAVWLLLDAPDYLTGSTIAFDGASLRSSVP